MRDSDNDGSGKLEGYGVIRLNPPTKFFSQDGAKKQTVEKERPIINRRRALSGIVYIILAVAGIISLYIPTDSSHYVRSYILGGAIVIAFEDLILERIF